MKVKSIQKINETLLKSHLFGVKYTINSQGVNISTFTPTLLSDESRQSTYLSRQSRNVKLFRVSLLAPFFLPLQTALNGLYEECLFLLPEMLKNNESINVIWLLQKRNNWREEAVRLYGSYLEGNDDPSHMPIFRSVQDKMYSLIKKVSPSHREYSEDVERKILDDGYIFQCMIEIQSDRYEEISSIMQDIFMQYDFHNGLRLEEIDYVYPYNLYPTSQLLSKGELLSLFTQTNEEIEISENPMQEQIKSNTTKSMSNWNERIKLLPHIPKEKIEEDDTILTRLAEALKRVGVISQARLYNESVQYGARLTTVHADIPKGKTFSTIEKKNKDIQVALGVESLSIEQGDQPDTVKFSLPNNKPQIVSLRELIERNAFHKFSMENPLSFTVGLDDVSNPIYLSLRNLRHLLVTGSTGSGKSVFVNQMITTLILSHTPDELKLYLIDPKQVELKLFEGFPHVANLITDMDNALPQLQRLVREMDKRYNAFSQINVKDFDGYNRKSNKKMPYFVVVIEEYADLRDSIGKSIEEPIKRLGQKARAAGIHMVLITQRPSSTVLSSDIQTNFANAISFNLNTSSNYKTVFGKGIPFTLLGRGDGVMRIESYPKEFQRFQSPTIAQNDIEESVVIDGILSTYEERSQLNISKPKEESMLDKLKRIIATTNETRVTVLREKLSIKSDTLSTLMDRLVSEGWLIRHKNRQKGYELIVDDDILNEWRDRTGQ